MAPGGVKTDSDYDVVDPYAADRREAMKQLYDYEEPTPRPRTPTLPRVSPSQRRRVAVHSAGPSVFSGPVPHPSLYYESDRKEHIFQRGSPQLRAVIPVGSRVGPPGSPNTTDVARGLKLSPVAIDNAEEEHTSDRTISPVKATKHSKEVLPTESPLTSLDSASTESSPSPTESSNVDLGDSSSETADVSSVFLPTPSSEAANPLSKDMRENKLAEEKEHSEAQSEAMMKELNRKMVEEVMSSSINGNPSAPGAVLSPSDFERIVFAPSDRPDTNQPLKSKKKSTIHQVVKESPLPMEGDRIRTLKSEKKMPEEASLVDVLERVMNTHIKEGPSTSEQDMERKSVETRIPEVKEEFLNNKNRIVDHQLGRGPQQEKFRPTVSDMLEEPPRKTHHPINTKTEEEHREQKHQLANPELRGHLKEVKQQRRPNPEAEKQVVRPKAAPRSKSTTEITASPQKTTAKAESTSTFPKKQMKLKINPLLKEDSAHVAAKAMHSDAIFASLLQSAIEKSSSRATKANGWSSSRKQQSTGRQEQAKNGSGNEGKLKSSTAIRRLPMSSVEEERSVATVPVHGIQTSEPHVPRATVFTQKQHRSEEFQLQEPPNEDDTNNALNMLLDKMSEAADDLRQGRNLKVVKSRRQHASTLHSGELVHTSAHRLTPLTGNAVAASGGRSLRDGQLSADPLAGNLSLSVVPMHRLHTTDWPTSAAKRPHQTPTSLPPDKPVAMEERHLSAQERALQLDLAPRAPSVPKPLMSPVTNIIDPSELHFLLETREAAAAQWSDWSEWGECFCGKQLRTRFCEYDVAYMTRGCDGRSYDARKCTDGRCPTSTVSPRTSRTKSTKKPSFYTLAPRNPHSLWPIHFSRATFLKKGYDDLTDSKSRRLVAH